MDKKTTKLHPLFYKRISDLAECLIIAEMFMPDDGCMSTFHQHAERLLNFVNEVVKRCDNGTDGKESK